MKKRFMAWAENKKKISRVTFLEGFEICQFNKITAKKLDIFFQFSKQKKIFFFCFILFELEKFLFISLKRNQNNSIVGTGPRKLDEKQIRRDQQRQI